MGGTGGTDAPPLIPAWATWPMPNQPGAGLPNQQSYMVVGDMSGVSGMSHATVRDEVTGLVWQRDLADERFTWQAARDYCAALNLAGWDDWRLPSRIELVSILELSRTNPSIDRVAFPGTRGEWHWTASSRAGDMARAWAVYFYFGYPDTDDKEIDFRVRCVRHPAMSGSGSPGSPAVDQPRYDVQSETVRDLRTRLTWQRNVSADSLPLQLAQDYCAALTLAGRDDWRLPSLQEFQTVVDEGRVQPAMDPQAFPGAPSAGFWSATRWAGTPELAWHVDFDTGSAAYDTATMLYRVRCLRWEP